MKRWLWLVVFLVLPLAAFAGDTFNPFTGQRDIIPTIQEEDGSPSVWAATTIKFPNGSLTDNADGSVSLFSTLSITGGDLDIGANYIEFEEISTPATGPASNHGFFYAKDNGGVTECYWMDDADVERNVLTTGGGSQEQVDDWINALINDADAVHTRITITYDDANNAMDFVVDDMLQTFTLDDANTTNSTAITIAGAGIAATSESPADTIVITATEADDLASVTGRGASSTDSIDLGGASTFEIPNATDPDVSALGQISFDSDDFALRGYDGSAQFAIGQKIKLISFTITKPLDLDETADLGIWTNHTPFNFIVTAVYSTSDTDDTDYDLDECDYHDNTNNRATITDVTISTDGTGFYYNETTGLTHQVDPTHHIVFDNGAADPDSISVTIKGYFDANVD